MFPACRAADRVSPSEMVRQFMQYDLGDSLREQILYGNFMKLFGLTDAQNGNEEER